MPHQPYVNGSYCKKCGDSVASDANYCQKCGTPISPDTASYDPAELVKDFYPTYMVTLVSIIQAAVLGYLLLAVYDQLRYIDAGTYDPYWTILILATFLLIVATWIQYTRAAIAMRFVPSTLDSLVPFFFGVSQALVIFSINLQHASWFYFACTLTSLVALSAYISVYRQLRQHQDRIENRAFLSRLQPTERIAIRWSMLRGAIFFSFGVIEALLALQSLLLATVVLAMNVAQIVIVRRWTEQIFGENAR